MVAARPRGKPPIVTLAGHAAKVLSEMIFSGELEPGARIYADEEAEKLGMSLIPVREALRTLASRGLVEAIPQRGFRVRPADRDDFAETYALRQILDPYSARLAVPRMTPDTLAELDRALDALSRTIESGDTTSYDTDHRDFHFAIYHQSGSRWLIDIQSMLWENSLRYQRLSTGLRGGADQRIAEHRAIADACHLGDADLVADLVFQHLEHTRTVVMDALSETGTE